MYITDLGNETPINTHEVDDVYDRWSLLIIVNQNLHTAKIKNKPALFRETHSFTESYKDQNR